MFSKLNETKQEAQLPQRNSASAANMDGEGLSPPAHPVSAPSGYTYAHGRIRNPQQTYVKRAVPIFPTPLSFGALVPHVPFGILR